jgi:thiopurine S-methyltransferase
MEPCFWLERWQQGQIGFHRPTVNPNLVDHVAALPSSRGARVLVPLCGKTIDMVWLAQRGLCVVGVELSPLAVEAFFAEQQWVPTVTREAGFVRHSAHDVEIWLGDFFMLDTELIGALDGFYDRAAMVALPPDLRAAYAKHLATLMSPDARGLVISFEYPEGQMEGPPFSVSEGEVHALYEPAFRVTHLGTHDALDETPHLRERGVTVLHEHMYSIEARVGGDGP